MKMPASPLERIASQTESAACWPQLRVGLSECARFLHGQGWTPATSSNFSARFPEGEGFLVSASGLDKGGMTSEDWLPVSLSGQTLFGESRQPSAETALHAMLYRLDPSIQSVLHTHSVSATVLSKRYQSFGYLELADFEMLKAFEGIKTHQTRLCVPIFENDQDMSALAKKIEAYFSKNSMGYGFLLAGHGLYAWGSSVSAACRHVEAFEFLFACALESDRDGSTHAS